MEYDDNDGTSQTDEISQEDSKFTAETRLQLHNPVNRRTHPFEVLWKKRGPCVIWFSFVKCLCVMNDRYVSLPCSGYQDVYFLQPKQLKGYDGWAVTQEPILYKLPSGGFINKSVNVRRGIHGRNHRFLIHIRHDWMAFSYHSRQLCPFIPGSATDIFG
jgi:hypothetical protein